MPDASLINPNLISITLPNLNRLNPWKLSPRTHSSPTSCSKTSVLTSTTSSLREWWPWPRAKSLPQRSASLLLIQFLRTSVSRKWRNRNRSNHSIWLKSNFPEKLLKILRTNRSLLSSYPQRNHLLLLSSWRSLIASRIWTTKLWKAFQLKSRMVASLKA